MSSAEARSLETTLESNPGDFDARCQLIAYYTAQLAKAAVESARKSLVRHSLWMMENHPESPVAGLVALDPSNLSRATPEEVERERAIWAKQLTVHSRDLKVMENASEIFALLDPPLAEKAAQRAFEIDANNGWSSALLAWIYASAIFGVTGAEANGSYIASQPETSAPFAIKARRELETASDPALLGAAGRQLITLAAALQGKIHVDYAPLAEQCLAKALESNPADEGWRAALIELHDRTAAPPPQPETNAPLISVDPALQARKLTHFVKAPYPPAARDAGLSGKVRFHIEIGTDGRVEKFRFLSGERPLIPTAMYAARQWVYEPTLVDGKPVRVATDIAVEVNP